MDDHEIKNLKAKVALLEGIKDDDRMLMHTVRNHAVRIIDVLRKANARKEDGEGIKNSVHLTTSEFEMIWNFVNLINPNDLGLLDGTAERYATAKKTKEDILKLL